MLGTFAFLEAESKLCGQHYVQIRQKSDNTWGTEMPDIGTSFLKLGVVEERVFIPSAQRTLQAMMVPLSISLLKKTWTMCEYYYSRVDNSPFFFLVSFQSESEARFFAGMRSWSEVGWELRSVFLLSTPVT